MKLKHLEIPPGTPYGWIHWCPGCEQKHRIPTSPDGPQWTFNGDMDHPSFQPSVSHFWEWGEARSERRCHYFITGGVIQFCGDSTHALAGKSVPLPELPEN